MSRIGFEQPCRIGVLSPLRLLPLSSRKQQMTVANAWLGGASYPRPRPLLLSIADGRWHPGIGDPTLLGWLTVALYLAAAAICWRAAVVARGVRWPEYTRGEPLFWLLCAVFLLCLGINKQLDLQTWFTIVGKNIAQQTGWYAERRVVQMVFIVVIAFFGLVLGAIGAWWTTRLSFPCRIAFLGAVFLGVFIIIRAASFHHVDQMLGFRFAGVRMNVLLEMGGTICMAAAALRVMWKGAPRTPTGRTTGPVRAAA
jgi:hypothetical protein